MLATLIEFTTSQTNVCCGASAKGGHHSLVKNVQGDIIHGGYYSLWHHTWNS